MYRPVLICGILLLWRIVGCSCLDISYHTYLLTAVYAIGLVFGLGSLVCSAAHWVGRTICLFGGCS
ncbi:hypothetical protein HOY82DRAFT_544635 [Tuber indicum]|nr:hypothetical protein HOY82DRAFT_544635 [Tuber indicum]